MLKKPLKKKKKPKEFFKKNEAIKKALTYGHKKEQVKCHEKRMEGTPTKKRKKRIPRHKKKNVYDYLQSFAIALQLTAS